MVPLLPRTPFIFLIRSTKKQNSMHLELLERLCVCICVCVTCENPWLFPPLPDIDDCEDLTGFPLHGYIHQPTAFLTALSPPPTQNQHFLVIIRPSMGTRFYLLWWLPCIVRGSWGCCVERDSGQDFGWDSRIKRNMMDWQSPGAESSNMFTDSLSSLV